MLILQTVAVAFSMYSVLPVPRVDWTDENLRCALAAFPLVGAFIGGACFLCALLCARFSVPVILRGALFCLLPPVLSGGIHLDGYADTADADASRADAARRQEILRDPHCGAFAVIRLCMFFVGFFALSCALPADPRTLFLFALCFVLSRVLSALALVFLPLSPRSSLAKAFAERRPPVLKGLLALEAALCALALLLSGGRAGAATLFAAALVFALTARKAHRDYGGMSGDLAGALLCKAEFWMLAALVAARL